MTSIESPLSQVQSSDSTATRKKKGKAEAAAPTPAQPSHIDADSAAPRLNGSDGVHENQYIKEIQKQIRNVNKKLNGMAKAEQIVQENSGVSLDDLVASKKLNQDQKAQIIKKPALLAQIASLEEQLKTYQSIDREYTQLHAKEKELLQSSHAAELQQMKDTIIAEQRLVAAKENKMKLLTLSKYLAAAAKRRNAMSDGEEETEESKAFEGLLSQVYGANPEAVYAAEKLIDGADEPVPGQDGVLTQITYAEIKKLSLEDYPVESEDPFSTAVSTHPPSSTSVPPSDPTTVHAGLTELKSEATVNGTAALETTTELDSSAIPAAAKVDEGAANAAAEEQWDTKGGATDDPLTESYEIIPRDHAETETREELTTTAASQSWADDTPIETSTADMPSTTEGASQQTDGFSEVRGRGRGHRGGGGEGRGGRGFRGDFRGRGRGRGDGFRGGRGRGGPRGEFRGGFRGGRGGAPAPSGTPAPAAGA